MSNVQTSLLNVHESNALQSNTKIPGWWVKLPIWEGLWCVKTDTMMSHRNPTRSRKRNPIHSNGCTCGYSRRKVPHPFIYIPISTHLSKSQSYLSYILAPTRDWVNSYLPSHLCAWPIPTAPLCLSSRTNRFCSCKGPNLKSYPSFLIVTLADPLSRPFVFFLNEALGETNFLFSSLPVHHGPSLFSPEFLPRALYKKKKSGPSNSGIWCGGGLRSRRGKTRLIRDREIFSSELCLHAYCIAGPLGDIVRVRLLGGFGWNFAVPRSIELTCRDGDKRKIEFICRKCSSGRSFS